ncbi:hypothetical protein GCM10007907_15090 [Chitinimonas prasina]|uniref:DUF4197 domain-containing protein n=1 Tax=Chitinimonas prasina TaxID=1434937 RepID=A0ABQ5YIF0_9NEIS|nr:DUF4197 domain-containing protein [Chitinimonas prasina]GLR12719.1 hypothetical protein GCM10007907_15090 [Chitinimonas prasina]
MRTRRYLLTLLLTAGLFAQAEGLDQLNNKDAASGLKEALTQAATVAVGQLGKADGFLGNSEVKIPLPDGLRKAEKLLRTLGQGERADELVTSMNRAAEKAVQEAKPVLVDSIKKMSWQDAKGILAGGETAATDYFRRTTSEAISARFKPIVEKATAKVKLAEKYNAYAGQAAQLGLIKREDANLDNYVTQRTLDGLFLMIAKEEKSIRADPMGQASKLLRKVFGVL